MERVCFFSIFIDIRQREIKQVKNTTELIHIAVHALNDTAFYTFSFMTCGVSFVLLQSRQTFSR